jgi:7,8-dihydropterin-6-yl-methyl-4-(beta-D-ribofuranosyl)aminobenzene 5'-phosphate synthase
MTVERRSRGRGARPEVAVEVKMKLTVLVDNNTLTDQCFLGESALSHFIETEGRKTLFDVGYSDAFITNARKLHIDLLDVDFVVLSHGHLDHTWGLVPLVRLYTEGLMEKLPVKKPTLVAHPLMLLPKTLENLPEVGSLLPEEKLSGFFDVQLSREPVWLTNRLVFLGEIERSNDFEAKKPIGKVLGDGVEKDDFLLDDSALAYKSRDGLVIVTGCSHAGICNIVEQARRVCGEERVVDIVGGLHLLDPSAEQLQGTLEYLRALRPGSLHACHCTDLRSKIALSRVVDLKEVGVGLALEY